MDLGFLMGCKSVWGNAFGLYQLVVIGVIMVFQILFGMPACSHVIPKHSKASYCDREVWICANTNKIWKLQHESEQMNFYFWIALNVLCIPVQIVPNSYDHTDLDAWFGMISGSAMDLDVVTWGSFCLVSEVTSLNSFACLLSLVSNFLREENSSSLVFINISDFC